MDIGIKTEKILQALLPSTLLLSLVFFQYIFDLQKKARPTPPLSIMPAEAIKLSDLGLHSAAAGMAWINTIQKLSIYPEKMADLIKNVNSIDPKFSYPYAFAAFILPNLKMTDDAIAIASEGIAKADQDWRIPFYLATTYHIFKKDRVNAAYYFDIASSYKDAPEQIRRIAARYGISQTGLEQTKLIWSSLLETSRDEVLRDQARKYLIHIEIIEELQKIANLYNQKFGRYPEKIETLIDAKMIKKIPLSPLGIKYYIKSSGEISVE